MKRQRLLVLSVILAVTTVHSSIGYGATAQDFETPEYKGMTALEYIKASSAYAKGYTGQGVRLGEIDCSVRVIHPDFAGKNISLLEKYTDNIDWVEDVHGTHVAGIMLANKDGLGMHGVAYKAKLAASAAVPASGNERDDDLIASYDFINSQTEVKIINNSYGKGAPIEIQTLAAYGDSNYRDIFYYDLEGKLVHNSAEETAAFTEQITALSKSANDYNKLYVYANGNSGFLSGETVNSNISFYEPSLKNNTIAVIAGNTDPNDVWHNNGLAYFTQLAMFNEDSTLTAPGVNIFATQSGVLDVTQPISFSGTSMASPVVSGVLGLVQEAYPYLTAKQIADVGLSTASAITVDENTPFFTMRTYTTPGYEAESAIAGLNILNYNNAPKPTTQAEWKTLLYNVLKCNSDDDYNYYAEVFGLLDADGNIDENKLYFYNDLPSSIAFGQGMIDADKATNGLGTLNANRLEKTDLDTNYAANLSGQKQALYKVDTAGYNSVWSNDISETRVLLPSATANGLTPEEIAATGSTEFNSELAERQKFYGQYAKDMEEHYYLENGQKVYYTKVEDVKAYIAAYNKALIENPLLNLHVGLYKQGEGILRLTGNNTYKGSSIAAGGTLAIDGTVAGDAYSVEQGTIGGSGTITGNLYNAGVAQPGSYTFTNLYESAAEFKTGTLKVDGNLNSTGAFAIAVAGDQNSKIAVTGSATLGENTVIQAVANYYPEFNKQYDFLSADSVTGNIKENIVSPFVAFTGEVAATGASFTANKTAALESISSSGSNEYAVLQAVNKWTDGLYGQDSLSSQQEKDKKELTALYYGDQNSVQKLAGGLTAEGRIALEQSNILGKLSNKTLQNRLDRYQLEGDVVVEVPLKQMVEEKLVDNNISLQTALPVALDASNNLWVSIFRGQDSQATGNVSGRTFGGIIGYDKSINLQTRLGVFASYGSSNYSGDSLAVESKDWRAGVYGSHVSGPWTYQGAISYGDNHYDSKRFVLGESINGDYHSKLWDVFAKAKYTVPSTREKTWQVIPYGALEYTHNAREAYAETASSIFGQQVKSASMNTTTAEIGVEFQRKLTNTNGWGGSVGYKRILNGANPGLEGNFIGSGGVANTAFTLQSAEDKNYITYSLSAYGALDERWLLQGEIQGERSAHNHNELYSVMLKYSF